VNRAFNRLGRLWKFTDSEKMRICNPARDVKMLFELKVQIKIIN